MKTIKYMGIKNIELDSSQFIIYIQLNVSSYLSFYWHHSFYLVHKTYALQKLITPQRKQPFVWSCMRMFLLINSY